LLKQLNFVETLKQSTLESAIITDLFGLFSLILTEPGHCMSELTAHISTVRRSNRTVGCFFTEYCPCIMTVHVDKESSSSQSRSNFHLVHIMMPLNVAPPADLHGKYATNINVLHINKYTYDRIIIKTRNVFYGMWYLSHCRAECN